MNSIFAFFAIGSLMLALAAPAWAASDENLSETRCFDSQQYRLVPCPRSGKAMVIVEEEKTPEDKALSFLRELAPYTKLDTNGEPLPETAEEWAMVRDNTSGLIWEIKDRDRESVHFYAQRLAWTDLQEAFIDPLNEEAFGGFSDWRLPTPRELYTLMITSTRVPIVELDFFPLTRPDSYWTGVFRTDTPDYACHVDFYLGHVHYSPKNQKNHVRAVRMSEEFTEERKITLPEKEKFRQPKPGITDTFPDTREEETSEMPEDQEDRAEQERFTEPRRGITDLPPDRKRQSVPFRRMRRQ